MRLIKIIAFCFLVSACQKKITGKQVTGLNGSRLSSYAKHDGNYMIISCIRCSCFNTLLKDFNPEDVKLFNSYTLFADTNCTKLPFPVSHVSQKEIDDISSDIYNVVLVKRHASGFVTRLIETDESRDLIRIIRNFGEIAPDR